MYKKILLIIVLVSFTANAQDTIRGKMKPTKNYSYIILNQLNTINKKYITNTVITNGEFKLVIPKDAKPGMYRLEYDVNKNLFIDFLYNNENIDFEFHPDYPNDLVKFNTSNENKLYQTYIDEVSVIQNKLDSVQVKYFQTKDIDEEKILHKIYIDELIKINTTQNIFSKKSKGMLVYNFINANKRHYNEDLIKDTDAYLENLKFHYFDNIDFNNGALIKSSLLIDKVMDFVLYLTNSKDRDEQIKLRKKAITTSLDKIESNKLKSDIIQSLLYLFAQQENKEITDYIFKNHFSKLPIALQDLKFKETINGLFKTAIGQPAPNIEWDVFGKPYNLETLEKSEYYVVLFWGSTCAHCLKEIPKLNEFFKTNKNIKTIAIGIEDTNSKAGWKEETFELENMTHILGLSKTDNKWDNTYVRDYGVTGTPAYFILDSDKKIIAKPYDFVALKEFFEKTK
ncbi:MAG: TlpA family protein disulfide reductase [Flavobacteriaceae bacterium]|nr:TlpA family protein disulfide reductase [Flavobacteriaceae bacterium]